MFITQMNPAVQVGGSSVVLNNLLSSLDSSTYTVCYFNYFKFFNPKEKVYKNSIRLIPNYSIIHLFGIFNNLLFDSFEYVIRPNL